MVLKSDDHDDTSEASYTLLASECKRGQKGLRKRKDRSSINRRSNDIKEVLHSDTGKDKKSLKSGQVNSLGQGFEVAESKTSPGNFGAGHDMEDGQHESMKVIRPDELLESDENIEPSLQTSLGDDVDDSDFEEEDVKVCDICGDAGREDLLAVCSRCSDGAEHTYCMREMLDKVPEGDWLCEECKYNEALELRKQEHLKLLGTERSKSLGRTNSIINSDVSSKLDSKDSFTERIKPKTVGLSKQLSLKRSGDSIEVGQTAKKQVVESSTGSPTTLSPNRAPVLSKDFSSKNLEKTKGKPINQYSTGNESGGDSSENTQSPTKGNLLKSNSFSSSKANVKFSEEVVQKQKLVVDVKDVPGKLIGKSMSFKGLGRSSIGEPKVKMLSPKCAPSQDSKGQKQIRDRNSFERKNSIKLDNSSFPGQIALNSTKRVYRGDNFSSLPVSNSRDYKHAPFDGKSTSLGEVKRLSSTNIRGSLTISSVEAKLSHASSKDGTTFNSSRALDGSYGGANGTKGDSHDIQSERTLENTFGRSKQGVNGSSVGSYRRRVSSDSSTLRAKDGVHEENKLKAALEVALQKKQDIVKKNKIPEKLSESFSQGNHFGDLVSNQGSDLISEEVVLNHMSNSCKNLSVGSLKQLKVGDIVSNNEEDQFTVLAIPEQEAVWQGGFEIHRNGKLPDFCGGFQAHLSSLASDKVLEVVRKLPQKIVFNEVSRPCVWPFQIKEARVRDDNIALYFFAKDVESYVRSYKILLEYMMKHDLALKGNINGFELLIFPSNHLAQRSQRWNTLFFLWGVFRGKRARCVDDRCPPLEMPEIDVSLSTTVPRVKDIASLASLSKNTSLQRPEIEDSSLSGISSQKKSGPLVNGDCRDEGRDVGGTCLTSPTSQVNIDDRCEKYSSVVSSERRSESGTTVVQDHRELDPEVVLHDRSWKDRGNVNNLHESNKSMSNNLSDKQDKSHSSKLHMVVKKEDCPVFSSQDKESNIVNEKFDNSLKKEDQFVDNINVEQNEEKKDSTRKNDVIELKSESWLKQEGYVDINVPPECNMEDLQSSPERHLDENLVNLPSKPISMTSQTGPWMDQRNILDSENQASISKRLKETSNFYGHEIQRVPSSFSDSFDTQMHDVSTSSRIDNETRYDKSKSLKSGSTERCFFLMDSNVGQSVQLEDCSSPWKVSLLETENRLPHTSPDLELALGVEKKQSGKGVVLPFFGGIVDGKGPDRPPDLITSPREEDEDGSASLSLSLAFPFSDTDSSARLKGL